MAPLVRDDDHDVGLPGALLAAMMVPRLRLALVAAVVLLAWLLGLLLARALRRRRRALLAAVATHADRAGVRHWLDCRSLWAWVTRRGARDVADAWGHHVSYVGDGERQRRVLAAGLLDAGYRWDPDLDVVVHRWWRPWHWLGGHVQLHRHVADGHAYLVHGGRRLPEWMVGVPEMWACGDDVVLRVPQYPELVAAWRAGRYGGEPVTHA